MTNRSVERTKHGYRWSRSWARRAGFDHGSEDYEAALRYLLDLGYLRPAAIVGGEGYSITAAGVGKLDER
jgi:hypothetical protein